MRQHYPFPPLYLSRLIQGRSLGAAAVLLHVHVDNVAAQRLYTRLGYALSDRLVGACVLRVFGLDLLFQLLLCYLSMH